MKGKLKLIMDSNGEIDLENYSPKSDFFCMNILLGIGLNDDNKMDYFELRICSIKWIELNEEYPIILRNTLIVKKYNYKELLKTLENYICKCEGSSWEDISLKLSRYFSWEFENYSEIQMLIY